MDTQKLDKTIPNQEEFPTSCDHTAEVSKKVDLIDRQAAIDALEKVAELYPWRVPGDRDSYSQYNEGWTDAIGRAEIALEELPSAQPDRGYIDQIRWERDTAIQQLKELGYSLGEKPRTHSNYKTYHGYMWLCPECGLAVHSDYTRCVRCGYERREQ